MPDERRDSIEQGINAPEESGIGREAAEKRRRRAAEGPEIGGGMGGTSDADSPADEALGAAQQEDARGSEKKKGRERNEEPDTSDHPRPDDLE